MIPPNLDAFRKLMERAVRQYEPSVGVTRTFAIPEETRQQRQEREHAMRRQLHADYDALRTLATATPEQLLGIAFAIRDEFRADYGSGYYVTPRYAIPRETSGE